MPFDALAALKDASTKHLEWLLDQATKLESGKAHYLTDNDAGSMDRSVEFAAELRHKVNNIRAQVVASNVSS
jgi:hypothetical protein